MGESSNKRHKQIDIKIIVKKENLAEEANNKMRKNPEQESRKQREKQSKAIKYERKSGAKKRKQRAREM
jgi:hypothetical protein